jgi:hypothetical protein
MSLGQDGAAVAGGGAAGSGRLTAGLRRHVTPSALRRLALFGALVAVVGAFYFWTSLTSVGAPNYYGLLAESFSNGDLALPIEPPPELLALDDPYDPAQNAGLILWDASLYQGKYYLYFGPTPALLLYLPLRLVGVELSDAVAVPLFGLAGFACSAALLLFLLRRYLPRTPPAWRALAVLGLGFGSALPFVMRRPAVYEVAITAGYFTVMAGLLLLATGVLRERPSYWRLGAGSLLMGLAVGARPNLAIVGIAAIGWAWWRATGRDAALQDRLTTALPLAFPFAACLLILGLYNHARFGSFTEFGASYQLSNLNNRITSRFELSHVAPGLFLYLLVPPTIDATFPFFHLAPSYPGTLPSDFTQIEPVAGVFAVVPIVAILVAAPVLHARTARSERPTALIFVLAGSAVALMLVSIVALQGVTMRYEVDFAGLLMFAGILTWLWAAEVLRPRHGSRALLLGTGAVAIAYTVMAQAGFSITGYYDGLRAKEPGQYASLQRFFSFVPGLVAEIRGEPFVEETYPEGVSTSRTTQRIASPDADTIVAAATFTPNPALAPETVVRVEVSDGRGLLRGFGMPVGGRRAALRIPLSDGVTTITTAWRATRTPRDATPEQRAAAAAPGLAIADLSYAPMPPGR